MTAIKLVLLFLGSVLLLAVGLAIFSPGLGGADGLRAGIFSWRGLLLLSCYSYLLWAFFLSSSVHDYVRQRRMAVRCEARDFGK